MIHLPNGTCACCPLPADPRTGHCAHHSKLFFGGTSLTGGGTKKEGKFTGREVWNANQAKICYVVIWYLEDRPEQQLNVKVVDAGLYRIFPPDPEKGTIQDAPGVKCKKIAEFDSAHSVEDAFKHAILFIERDMRMAEIRKWPTYMRQVREEMNKVVESVKPLKDAP